MPNRISRIAMSVAAFALMLPLALSAGAPTKTPEFTLPTAAGGTFSSTAQRGHRVVAIFYVGYY